MAFILQPAAGMIQEKPPRELIFQGAEAKVYKIQYNGAIAVEKQRASKPYRHPELDKKITKERVKSESAILLKAHKLGIPVPLVLKTSPAQNSLIMEYIDGIKLKDWFNQEHTEVEIVKQLMKMGFLVYRLHQQGIIHGDLTTSNMILRDNKIYLIDFGLSYIKNIVQSKAVDLYVLQRAFVSTHPQLQEKFSVFYQGYADEDVLKRLQAVRQRGRKKVAFG